MKRFWRSESGQGMAFPAFALVSLMGMTAFTLDVGAWFRADRHMQAVADAAALAGAHALPASPSKAVAIAQEYAAKNGGPTATEMVIFRDRVPNDSIRVRYTKTVDGVFSRVLSIANATVGARASARATSMSAARWVAPIVVSEKHKMLSCTPPPCAGAVELEYSDPYKVGGAPAGAGSFGFIDIGSSTGVGTSDLYEQIAKGYAGDMEIGKFSARTGASFSALAGAFDQRIGTELLFPVYKQLIKVGTIAEYTIIGWVGFRLTSYSFGESQNIIRGEFTRVVWEGIPAEDPSKSTQDFGAFVVQLTK